LSAEPSWTTAELGGQRGGCEIEQQRVGVLYRGLRSGGRGRVVVVVAVTDEPQARASGEQQPSTQQAARRAVRVWSASSLEACGAPCETARSRGLRPRGPGSWLSHRGESMDPDLVLPVFAACRLGRYAYVAPRDRQYAAAVSISTKTRRRRHQPVSSTWARAEGLARIETNALSTRPRAPWASPGEVRGLPLDDELAGLERACG